MDEAHERGVFHGRTVAGEGEHKHSMFRDVWYPENDVLAVIDSPAEADGAAHELREAGFSEGDVLVMRDGEVEERLDATGRHCHWLGHFVRMVWAATTEEGRLFLEYESEGAQGRTVVAVHTHDPNDVETARKILASRRARRIEYFGHLGFMRTLQGHEHAA